MIDGPGSELVIVSIAQRRYAIGVEFVREVIPILDPTPVPAWPDGALGLFELRGEVVPLLDVAPALGHPPTVIRPSQRVLILELGSRSCGIVVDGVDGVRDLPVQISASLAEHDVLPSSALVRSVALDELGPVTVLEVAQVAQAAGLPNVAPPPPEEAGA